MPIGPKHAIFLGMLWIGSVAGAIQSSAQITPPRRKLSATPDRYANLQEQLVNRLRAFDDEKRSYLEMVVQRVREEKLDPRLVLAIERYAIRRNAAFPFPFFERALRFEAGKRGVPLPTVKQFAASMDSRR